MIAGGRASAQELLVRVVDQGVSLQGRMSLTDAGAVLAVAGYEEVAVVLGDGAAMSLATEVTKVLRTRKTVFAEEEDTTGWSAVLGPLVPVRPF